VTRTPPTGTYRLQLHRGFDFDAAAAVVPYLADLGVSHLYLSPILAAVPGSTHGYDVIDHTRLSPDLGGREAFERLVAAAHARGLGLIVDVVPNHMAVPTPAVLNVPLWSLLRDGPASPYANWFDVDWAAQDRAILMPVLGRRIGQCLTDGEIGFDMSGPEPLVRYHEHMFPVRPGTEHLPLPAAIDRQYYRLAWWRVADEELNYRRFFDVDTLAALRMEDPAVFAATHALLLEAYRGGAIDGLRIDHPDGLAHPGEYLRRLADATDGAWVVVEKILAGDETLPADWPVAGTTGYDALNLLLGLLLDPAGGEPLTAIHTQLTGVGERFAAVAETAKRDVLAGPLYAEVTRLADLASAICRDDIMLRDFTHRGIREALVEMLVAIGVYRAYVEPGQPAPPETVALLERAAEAARAALPDRADEVGLVTDLALGRTGSDRRRDEFVVRFAQTTGPVMAKGVEDTAFYRWFRLAALNEVGGDPGRFGRDVDEVHAWAARTAREHPGGLVALSTHDTKRSEDVRARLAVLSECPTEWARRVEGWREAAAAYRTGDLPDPLTEYLLWQTLVGAWPLSSDRLVAYLHKAAREAKQHTSWTHPDAGYEEALERFATGVLADGTLLADVAGFVELLAPATRANVLGQKLVALTVPGVPDLYQGTELVSLALVDPDNRRPVDYAHRTALLAGLDADPPLPRPADLDVEKLAVTRAALRARRDHPDWFGPGASYEPLATTTGHVFGFVRAGRAVTVITRLAHRLERAGGFGEAGVALPPGRWRDVLTDRGYEGGMVPAASLLDELPVALLLADHAAPTG
jgi:(1->4)-alpha-D-glucan 1-alpha-D-glucosylmutase